MLAYVAIARQYTYVASNRRVIILCYTDIDAIYDIQKPQSPAF